jgi:hypothetical protein
MTLDRLRACTLQQRIILLLLPVLAFRLLFPAGFMPRFGDGLELSMQMCHGDAQSAAVIRLLDPAPAAPDDDRGQHDAPCAFAATGSIAPAEPPPFLLAAALHHPDAEPLSVQRPALRPTRSPQAPRAPPHAI